MSRTTPWPIAQVHGAFVVLRVVSCWFWARQVLLLFYAFEAGGLVEEVNDSHCNQRRDDACCSSAASSVSSTCSASSVTSNSDAIAFSLVSAASSS